VFLGYELTENILIYEGYDNTWYRADIHKLRQSKRQCRKLWFLWKVCHKLWEVKFRNIN